MKSPLRSVLVFLSRFGWEKRWAPGADLRNPFYPLARFLCGLPPARLSRGDAVRIFEEVLEERGFKVRRPIWVVERLKEYYLRDNADGCGNNIFCYFNGNTGEVTCLASIPY